MHVPDLLTGLLLMNAMPHYILGVWKGKMLSGFGTGNTKNIVWGLCNFAASIALFVYQHGWNGFVEHQMYTGALIVLVTFFFTAPFWYKYYNR